MSIVETTRSSIEQEVKPSELLSTSDIIVFDMDGTLYSLDGENNGFQNSSLSKKVLSNTVKLIIERENISEESAKEIVNEVIQSGGQLSVVIGNRFSMTRKELFNITWNIDPDGILKNFETSKKTIKEISKLGKQLILLTSAPKIWQDRVLNYLEVDDCFSKVYYGELFKQKSEIFSQISLIHSQKKILAVGDQYETDIKPALDLGMSGFQVKHPDDLLLLLK